MLALTRKPGETIVIGDDIEITVVEIKGDSVRISVNAPRAVKILRKEIIEDVQQENRKAAGLTEERSIRELEILIKNLKVQK